jgi:hypothetical protein
VLHNVDPSDRRNSVFLVIGELVALMRATSRRLKVFRRAANEVRAGPNVMVESSTRM